MDKKLQELLEKSGLSEEIVSSLQEAFDKKIADTRSELELSMREEFASRYENDKNTILEALDRMSTDVITKHEAEQAEEFNKLTEARKKFQEAAQESRNNYKTKLREHLSLTRRFANEQLVKEATDLRKQKKALSESRNKIQVEYKNLKEALAHENKARLKKIDEFVIQQIGKELKDFSSDQRALVETRVKLVAEGRKRLKEMQSKFVKASAEKVETMVNESLKREMSQLHENLERNRQNMFGRRIFEAVVAEYMTSYLSEGTDLRKLTSVLEGKDKELEETKSKLQEVEQKTEIVRRKAAISEDRAQRTLIMAELLSPLRGEKKAIMEGMLETTKTVNLRTAFNKLLPIVVNENNRKSPPEGKKLMEEKTTHTGDRMNRFYETASAESEVDTNSELAQVVRLAGIK